MALVPKFTPVRCTVVSWGRALLARLSVTGWMRGGQRHSSELLAMSSEDRPLSLHYS